MESLRGEDIYWCYHIFGLFQNYAFMLLNGDPLFERYFKGVFQNYAFCIHCQNLVTLFEICISSMGLVSHLHTKCNATMCSFFRDFLLLDNSSTKPCKI